MDIKTYTKNSYSDMLTILKELVLIPAPSSFEEKRADLIKEFFINIGFINVIIDEAKNVILPINCDNSNDITVLAAHTDTVFPVETKLEITEKDGKYFCPGIGDDAGGVIPLMFVAKYFIQNNIRPNGGIMFVFNSCEEGLGNLYGTKTLFKNYGKRIKQFISLDHSDLNGCYNECVGSKRYMVTVKTQGGHSFSDFGNTNAIYELSKVISKIYSIEIPQNENSITTVNVGIINGGTSINTIPQSAEMLCEFRSNDKDCLEIMEEKFKTIFSQIDGKNVSSTFELIGDRPCGTAEMKQRSKYLCDIYEKVVFENIGKNVFYESGSTDSNVPISLGVPAITIGSFNGQGCHTLEEYLEFESLKDGLNIVLDFALRLLGENI